MNKKQIISLLVAAAVFVVTGVASVTVNTWSDMKQSQNAKNTEKAFGNLFGEMSESLPSGDYVAVIDVEGTIYSEPTTTMFGESEGYDHPATRKYVPWRCPGRCPCPRRRGRKLRSVPVS